MYNAMLHDIIDGYTHSLPLASGDSLKDSRIRLLADRLEFLCGRAVVVPVLSSAC